MDTMNAQTAEPVEYKFFQSDQKKLIDQLGNDKLLEILKKMLLIRNFEMRAESAYLHGHIGGFFHSYIGQEAISTAAVDVMGPDNWWITTYRCHGLSLLLGATPEELMCELYGRANGNTFGRGGSMHFYTDRMLGGFAIVGGHIPPATGAAFALKYQGIKDQVAVCFLGDGAVVQGAFHEALNLASLWDLPCIYVIENNHWGMGTPVEKAVCVPRLAEDKAAGYNMKAYTFDGMDYFNCRAGFEHVYREVVETSRPVLIEAVTERFRGHSVSDPGLYRAKDDLKNRMKRDPILLLKGALKLDEESYKKLDKEAREKMIEVLKKAEQSPWPDVGTLEEDVYAPSS